jgi:hypothetical protein
VQKRIEYPQFLYGGIKANHRAFPVEGNLRLFAADTETCLGRPLTLQAHDGTDTLFEYVTDDTIFKTFRDWIFDRSRARGVNICYFHYLRFDLPVLFVEKRLTMYEQVCEIKFDYKGVECELLFGKINKATLRYKDRKVHLLDSWSFTQASLDRSLKMYQIPYEKHAKPERIGKIRYDTLPEDHPERVEFETYARQDVVSLYHLSRAIMDFHAKYKVRPAISLPQFAARVFRHHFMRREEVIAFPPQEAVTAAELSYHGGKNGFYLKKHAVVEDLYEYDISSAYPFAMLKIPQMVKGNYARVKKYIPDLCGVYRVSGSDHGRYPLIFDHDFKRPSGDFHDLWVTGYEVERALRHGSGVTLVVHEGWVWDADNSYSHNPLASYVEHFYHLKETTPKSDAGYYFYKTMMNALYGKFVQTTELRTIELTGQTKREEKRIHADYVWDRALGQYVKASGVFRAGGLYNPFLATQVTGFVRGYLYDLETKHDALHSATDAIKTLKRFPVVKGLGGLKIETFGRCYLFRNKLYLHFAKSNHYCGHDLSKVTMWDGDQHLCKFALHGFKGEVKDLFANRHRLIAGEPMRYSYKHMVGLREGLRRGEEPCNMVTREEVMRL